MIKKIFFGIFFGLTMTLLSMSDIFFDISQAVNDGVYQQVGVTNSDICIIGIDAESIDSLGSFPFDRSVFADLITILNEAEAPPIAIGIDVLFTGETNEESDIALVEAVADSDNVILATSGNYGTSFVITEQGDSFLSHSSLLSMNYPFSALLNVSDLGHINSSLDEDGILRHGILTIKNQEDEEISSLALAMYEKYCDFNGISTGHLPENNWYISFTGKSGGYYDGYSLSKVLSGEIPSSVFANKLVFIGPYTIGLQDHFYTAIDHNNIMYGVEYQANALELLIKQEFVVPIAPLAKNLFLFSVMAILFIFTLHKKLVVSGSILFLVSGCYVFLCQRLFEVGFHTDVFYVPFAGILLFILHIVVNAVSESIEKTKVTATFKRYVAPEVVDQIFKEGVDNLKLGGSTMEISVMFIDVRNFTPMSEKFPPETVVEILNQLLDTISDTIMKNGGTLDKFIGDAIMCFWGAPLPCENHVELSVKTAVEITENLEEIIKYIKNKYKHDVSVGIGIQCGNAVVGNIGSSNRMDFTVIGDTVNTAARLESNAKGENSGIIISEKVHEKIETDYVTEKIEGGLDLKGKEGNFPAYRVLGKVK